ncbi:MAG: hypothetical protein M3350_02380 [Actinomycetota bacterium]|nr:hypothetical protein [Actinomycetota bacterium]
MDAAHSWGFDPSQPGAQALLKARAYLEEVEVEITKQVACVRFVGRYVGLGERVVLPKRAADALVENGLARRLAEPS